MSQQEVPQILGVTPPKASALLSAALLVTGLLLAACGQKGPLFLAPEATPRTSAPATLPATSVPADVTLPTKPAR